MQGFKSFLINNIPEYIEPFTNMCFKIGICKFLRSWKSFSPKVQTSETGYLVFQKGKFLHMFVSWNKNILQSNLAKVELRKLNCHGLEPEWSIQTLKPVLRILRLWFSLHLPYICFDHASFLWTFPPYSSLIIRNHMILRLVSTFASAEFLKPFHGLSIRKCLFNVSGLLTSSATLYFVSTTTISVHHSVRNENPFAILRTEFEETGSFMAVVVFRSKVVLKTSILI